MNMKKREFMRKFQIFLITIVFSTLMSSLIISQSTSKLYIINSNPGRVYDFAINQNERSDVTMIDKNPTMGMLGTNGKLLYILHDAWPTSYSSNKGWGHPIKASSLSIINTENHSLIKKIPLSWEVSNLILSNDSDHMLIMGNGKPYMEKPVNNDEMGNITLLDTRTGNIEFSISNWRWIQKIAFTKDFSRIVVLGSIEFKPSARNSLWVRMQLEPHFQQLVKAKLTPYQYVVTIVNKQGEIISQIELPKWENQILANCLILNMVLSKNEKWLYVFNPDKKSKELDEFSPSSIMSINMETGELVKSSDVGYSPYLFENQYSKNNKIITFKSSTIEQGEIIELNGSEIGVKKIVVPGATYCVSVKEPKGFYAIGKDKINFISNNLDTIYQVLNPEAFGEKSGIMPRIFKNSIYLQDANRMMVFTTKYEYALINTINHQLEKTGDIGRESVRNAKILASMFSPIMSDVFRVKYNLSLNNFDELNFIVGSKDEKFIYALELTSNDITILDVEKGNIVDIIPVGLNYQGIILSPDGKYLWALSSAHVKAIDTETNKVHIDHQNSTDIGEIKGIRFTDSNNSAAILYDHTMQIWDTEKGKIINEFRNLSSAKFLIFAKLE